jgi:DNA-binding LacI/PurR family transcriptional regulator
MATIKDIARECGVSAMTVSAVLNNKKGEVSASTRERVLEATRRLKYRPNAIARKLVGKRMNTIGIADRTADASYWSSPYESLIFDGILSSARRHRWDILYFAGHPIEEFNSSLTAYLDGRCDGMVYFSHNMSGDEAEQIIDTGLPVVLIGAAQFAQKNISVVDVDNEVAAHEAVSYLIGLGHRRIAMFQGVASTGSEQRTAAYRQAHVDAGIPLDESLILPSKAWEEAAYHYAREILARPEATRPTAAFCFNDAVAFGVMRAAHDMSISVPRELSVVGFDDVDPAANSNPPLTTIRQPLRQVGEQSVDLLIEMITEGVAVGRNIIVPHELVVRESTAPPTSA